MRQLVSVVTDQAVSYFIQEDDPDAPVQQVAQVLNTGLDIPDVIDLGANLLDALNLNGHRRKGIAARATKVAVAANQPALAPALEARGPAPTAPSPTPPGKRKRVAKRPRVNWGITRDKVLADIRAHPDTTYSQIAQRLTGVEDPRATASVTAAVGALMRGGAPVSVSHETGARQRADGRAGGYTTSHLRYMEARSPEPEPEPDPEPAQ